MGFSRQEYWSGLPLPTFNKLHKHITQLYDQIKREVLIYMAHGFIMTISILPQDFMIQFKVSEDNMLCHKDKISNDSGKLSG